MSLESETDVTSSGSSSTINVTVEETGEGPSTISAKVRITLYVEPGVFSPPASPPPNADWNPAGIVVTWPEEAVFPDSPAQVSFQLTPQSGLIGWGMSPYIVIVECGNPKLIQVHKGILIHAGYPFIFARADRYKLVEIKELGKAEPPPES
jgi:hypothetical protein